MEYPVKYRIHANTTIDIGDGNYLAPRHNDTYNDPHSLIQRMKYLKPRGMVSFDLFTVLNPYDFDMEIHVVARPLTPLERS